MTFITCLCYTYTSFTSHAARLLLTAQQPATIEDGGLVHITSGSRLEIMCSGTGTLIWESSSGEAIQVNNEDNPTVNRYQISDLTNNLQLLVFQSFDSSADTDMYTCTTTLNDILIAESVFITSGKLARLHNVSGNDGVEYHCSFS